VSHNIETDHFRVPVLFFDDVADWLLRLADHPALDEGSRRTVERARDAIAGTPSTQECIENLEYEVARLEGELEDTESELAKLKTPDSKKGK
jgi:hypothetical protein